MNAVIKNLFGALTLAILSIAQISVADSKEAMGNYHYACEVRAENNACGRVEDLGYCIGNITLTRSQATVSIFHPLLDIEFADLEFNQVLERVRTGKIGDQMIEIIASDEMDFSNGIMIGENYLTVKPLEAGSAEGHLTLEEDFSFTLRCIDKSIGFE